jgi:hypothetical protein
VRIWIKALWKAFIHMGSFFRSFLTYEKAPLQVAQARLEICNTCTSLEPITRQCLECFCFVLPKVQDLNQECPLKKW